MECLKDNTVLSFHPDTLESVRAIHGFKSQSEINDAINILETWIKKQDHFVEKNFDRGYLERVIISCKGSLERSKKQIDKICTMRSLPPYRMYFDDIDIKKSLAEVFDPSVCALACSPKLTKDHDRVIMYRQDIKKFTFEIQLKIFKMFVFATHYIKYNDYCDSYIIILDYTNADVASIIANFSIVELIKGMGLLTQGYGVRLKGIHIVCPSAFLEALIKLAKLGLPERLHNRVHAHRKYEAIYDYVPVELLPKDYGGEEELLDKKFGNMVDLLCSEEFDTHRREMNKAQTDESKRRTDTFNEQYMGMPGTFRTLSVD